MLEHNPKQKPPLWRRVPRSICPECGIAFLHCPCCQTDVCAECALIKSEVDWELYDEYYDGSQTK